MGALHAGDARDIFAAIPQVAELMQHRPRAGEDAGDFLARLRSSTTPEEAVTFTAFAALPQMGVWWGYEALRSMPDGIEPRDHGLMNFVAAWIATPSTDLRHRIMAQALYAPVRSPAVMLGLATGWSGGSIAPNDPMPVPRFRGPRSLNSAVLSCLARMPLADRSVHLARVIALAETLYRGM
ncbi:DUF6931 family protein [Jannaschia marina]|uniref:DUF6931 family protein n=1 Tax=Jannaschia marina TaxID=2741674 RepID=UPI002E2D4E0A|nr:hypothetical protein [Jannaschia marina]